MFRFFHALRNMAPHWQMLLAIAFGGLLGLCLNHYAINTNTGFFIALKTIGDVFMSALKLLVIPLVTSSIIVSLAQLGDDIGRMGRNTFFYYVFSLVAAVAVGVICVNVFTPGIVNGQALSTYMTLPASTSANLAAVEGKSLQNVLDIFQSLVPANLVKAASDGNLLGLIFFSLLYGFFLNRLNGDLRIAQLNFWRGVQSIMFDITRFVLRFAPIGVFALIAVTLAGTGFSALKPLLWFMATVLIALALHMLGSLSLLLRFVLQLSPRKHISAMSPALLTAFSTASSNATLPVTMRSLKERAGVSEKVANMSAPLGASMNMDGTALYECVAALFIAQAYGLELGWAQQATVVVIALLTGFGMAGIPAASLVAIAVILGALGLPIEALGLLLITDRLLDMCRTTVNVYSDSIAALFVARREGENLPALSQP